MQKLKTRKTYKKYIKLISVKLIYDNIITEYQVIKFNTKVQPL